MSKATTPCKATQRAVYDTIDAGNHSPLVVRRALPKVNAKTIERAVTVLEKAGIVARIGEHRERRYIITAQWKE